MICKAQGIHRGLVEIIHSEPAFKPFGCWEPLLLSAWGRPD